MLDYLTAHLITVLHTFSRQSEKNVIFIISARERGSLPLPYTKNYYLVLDIGKVSSSDTVAGKQGQML